MTPSSLDRRMFLLGLGSTAAALTLPRSGAAQAPDPASDPAHDDNRPAYHLLPPHNWMNDPNGPIGWKGKYHLFYQLNPHAAIWGDMHWGHAESTDMVHWHHLPIALAPTAGGPDSEGCFSGSAVVMDGTPTFIYTGVQNAPPDQATIRDGSDKLREVQMLATAADDSLLRWKKLAAPVIATPPAGITVTGFRDPCPWREADGWYLGIGSGERGKGGCVLLYRSQDLRHWKYLHKLAEGKPNGKVAVNPCDSGEMWECPDFFEVNGQHCLFYSTEGKVIWTTGEYDRQAHRFTPKRQGVLDHGAAYYAPKSFLAPDGRRIVWGWLRETRPESAFSAAGWAGAMSLPRVVTIDAQSQLEMKPAHEVESLRGSVDRQIIRPGKPYRTTLQTLRHEILLDLGSSSGKLSVELRSAGAGAWQMTIDSESNSVQCGDVRFPLPSLPWPRPALHLFLDGSVLECFLGGTETLTSRVYGLKPGACKLNMSIEGGKDIELSHWPLNAISPDRLTT
jgi:beta-fructofuranosidase